MPMRPHKEDRTFPVNMLLQAASFYPPLALLGTAATVNSLANAHPDPGGGTGPTILANHGSTLLPGGTATRVRGWLSEISAGHQQARMCRRP